MAHDPARGEVTVTVAAVCADATVGTLTMAAVGTILDAIINPTSRVRCDRSRIRLVVKRRRTTSMDETIPAAICVLSEPLSAVYATHKIDAQPDELDHSE